MPLGRRILALTSLVAVLACASVPPAAAPPAAPEPAGPREHVVRMGADGAFQPEVVTIRAGDTVVWKLGSRRDSVVRVAQPGQCATAAPWAPDVLAGPAGFAPSGIFATGPYGHERGFEVTRGKCRNDRAPEVVSPRVRPDGGRDILCETARKGVTMAETWQDPALTGVHIRLLWSDLQPERDRFDFALLTRELDLAVANGKLYTLSVKAGTHGTPEWIFSEGVTRLEFVDGPTTLDEGCGRPMTLGNPTERAYEEHWNRMLEELSRLVRSRADWYRALAYVRPNGANLFSSEARLPNRCLARCEVCNSEVWAKAGYRPSKLVGFFSRQEELLARLFPERPMSLQIIQAGFPRVSEAGCWLVGDAKDGRMACPRGVTPGEAPLPGGTEQTEALITHGVQRWGRRFHVQHNGLGPGPPPRSCPTWNQHPAVGPYRGAPDGCPNRWVLEAGAGPARVFTGFQTNNATGVGDTVQLDQALANAWHNSDAITVEIYEQRAWEAAEAKAAGIAPPSGNTVADWAEKFHERRRAMAAPGEPDPFPGVVRHTFSAPGTVSYANGRGCRPGTIVVR